MTTALTTLRDAFVKNLHMIKKSDCLLAPVSIKQINTLLQAINIDNISATQLIGAMSLLYSKQNLGMLPIKPLGNNPLDTVCFQFGQGRIGWYFVYGHLGDSAFNFILFRNDVAPPCILKKMGIQPADGCLYSLTAGYGSRGGSWVTLPKTTVQGKYQCENSTAGFSFTAVLGADCPWLQGCTLKMNTASSPPTISLDLSWLDVSGPVKISAVFTSKDPPIYQGPKGCLPCAGGLGTLYWSYTNMQVIAELGPPATPITASGVGWFDHQWLRTDVSNDALLTLIMNIKGMLSVPKTLRWLWLTLQLPDDLQYMISIILTDLPAQGQSFEFSATKISKSQPSYGVKGKATIKAMVDVKTDAPVAGLVQKFPTVYSIELEGNTYTLQGVFGNTVVYLNGGLNWEGPGDVLDASGTRIGTGFLEANQLASDEVLRSNFGSLIGMTQDKLALFKSARGSLCAGLLSLFILLIVIWAFVCALITILKVLWKALHRHHENSTFWN